MWVLQSQVNSHFWYTVKISGSVRLIWTTILYPVDIKSLHSDTSISINTANGTWEDMMYTRPRRIATKWEASGISW